ncbi:MAG TPA: DEAD/DEAH box helicase [Azospirillaceae bacterium]|nr:DEAD/DEAH box helicase [Azospirillaceae bacterium]
MTKFSDLGLSEPLLQAVATAGYTTPTPIQARAIPVVIEGRDVLGLAQTGTGKTAAFALPIAHRLSASKVRAPAKGARVLILVPTRELASQVDDCFSQYAGGLPLRRAVVTGGVGMFPQIKTMSRGVDILVATPGRLLDLISQGHVRLDTLEILVLDEADRMLDLGFVRDIRRIAAMVPANRQTLLFSATMPDDVASLAKDLLGPHERIEVTPPATTAERIEQRVLFVQRERKRDLLIHLLSQPAFARAIVFCRTKHGADRVEGWLERAGIGAAAIHGDKSQGARQRALDTFKAGRIQALVATDIAARGIDVDDVSHVINFDLPNEPDSYVHRIGRTARAGREGMAVSLCGLDEVPYLRAIEKVTRQSLPVDEGHPFHAPEVAASRAPASTSRPAPQQRPRPQGRPNAGGRPQQAPAAGGRPQQTANRPPQTAANDTGRPRNRVAKADTRTGSPVVSKGNGGLTPPRSTSARNSGLRQR